MTDLSLDSFSKVNGVTRDIFLDRFDFDFTSHVLSINTPTHADIILVNNQTVNAHSNIGLGAVK